MVAVYPDIKIATGFDNEAGFTVIEEIVVSGTTVQLEDILKGFNFAANTQYFVVHALPQQNRETTANGSSVQNGYEVIQWRFRLLSGRALEFWQDTYVGLVTIATLTWDIATAVQNFNAIGGYPEFDPNNRIHKLGHWWVQDVTIMMKLVATT